MSGSATDLSRIPDGSYRLCVHRSTFRIEHLLCRLQSDLGSVARQGHRPGPEAWSTFASGTAEGGKTLDDYAELMEGFAARDCASPQAGGLGHVVFHNTDSAVWQSLSEAASSAGFEFHEAPRSIANNRATRDTRARRAGERRSLRRRQESSKADRGISTNGHSGRRTRLVADRCCVASPGVMGRGVQGVHAGVMRHLMSPEGPTFPTSRTSANS